jgi:hypothetical protein
MKELLPRRSYETEHPRLEKRPVAFRYKNAVDVWVYTENESEAQRALDAGHDSQGLYVRDWR